MKIGFVYKAINILNKTKIKPRKTFELNLEAFYSHAKFDGNMEYVEFI
jgi:hypothetical protein